VNNGESSYYKIQTVRIIGTLLPDFTH